MTEFTKGASVFVHLTDGDSFLDEYVKDTAEAGSRTPDK